MEATQRKEFEAQLGALFGAWGRTTWEATTEGYWKGLQLMSLADFVRSVDRAVQNFGDDPDMKLPNVGVLWSIKRSLRASAPAERRVEPQPAGDKWTQLANHHLWNYLMRRIGGAKRYAPDAACLSSSSSAVTPGPETAARTKVLLGWRDSWAVDMREAEAEGTAPEDHGKQWWADCMKKAEANIDRRAA